MSEKKTVEIFSGKAQTRDNIPKRAGRSSKYDWDSLLGSIPEGLNREVDPKIISKATLINALRAYNARKSTNYRVVSRSVDGKLRIFIENPKPEKAK